jgi:hypothetical protein
MIIEDMEMEGNSEYSSEAINQAKIQYKCYQNTSPEPYYHRNVFNTADCRVI